jgi:hypothetical protein
MIEASLVNFAELVVLTVGVVIALQQLRDIKNTREIELETRQAQLFMQIFGRHFERETRENMTFVDRLQYENYDDFTEKYGLENNPDYLKLSSLATYYEGIGVFVKRNLIDPTMVDDLMSGPIIRFWEKMSKYIEELRTRTGHFESLEHVEYLYNVIKGIRDKQREAAGFTV